MTRLLLRELLFLVILTNLVEFLFTWRRKTVASMRTVTIATQIVTLIMAVMMMTMMVMTMTMMMKMLMVNVQKKYENTNQDSDCAKRPGSVASKPGYSHRNQSCFQKRKQLITLAT